MKKLYLLAIIFYFFMLGAHAVGISKSIEVISGSMDSIRRVTRIGGKIYDNRPDRPKNELRLNITPFKPIANRSTASSVSNPSGQPSTARTIAQPDAKVLSNVKVFPNPVSDHINISYSLTRDANVTVKIMDVLGNEITTLLSQRFPAGDQNHSFSIGTKLNSGYYFIRVISGNETIVKRISVL